MTQESLLLQAANITLVGMSVVFVFLILLVFVMKVMGAAVTQLEKYFPQQVQAPAPVQDNTLIAVAVAAAKRFAAK